MSIKVMSEVWEHAPFVGTDLLVLLALADMANEDRECWPGLKHIAWKARITVQRSIDVLEDLELQGAIEIVKRSTPERGHISNLYRIKKVSEWELLKVYEELNPTKAGISSPTQAGDNTLLKQALVAYSDVEGENITESSLETTLKPKKETILASDDAGNPNSNTVIKENPSPAETQPNPSTPNGAKPPSPAQPIVDLIKAYLDASGTVKPAMYGNKTVRAEAKELVAQGITPLHIHTFIQRLRQDAFWKGKEIKWAKVCGEIITHFKERPLMTTYTTPAEPIEPVIESPVDPTFDPDAFDKLLEDAANARAM